MFNLSGSEIIVILLLALVILGPDKLPDALRRAGRTYAELKKMSNSFQSEMKSVLDEPMQEMRETADLLRTSTQFEDHDPAKPGSGGRATPAVPRAAPARRSAPAPRRTPPPALRSADQPTTATCDEALINETLSGGPAPAPVAPTSSDGARDTDERATT